MLAATVINLINEFGVDKLHRIKSSDQVFFHQARDKFIFNHDAEVVAIIDKEPAKYEAGLVAINHGSPLYGMTVMSYNAIETLDFGLTEEQWTNYTDESRSPVVFSAPTVEYLDLITTDNTSTNVEFAEITDGLIKDVLIQNLSANACWITWGPIGVDVIANSSSTLLKAGATINLTGTKALKFAAIVETLGANVALRISGLT